MRSSTLAPKYAQEDHVDREGKDVRVQEHRRERRLPRRRLRPDMANHAVLAAAQHRLPETRKPERAVLPPMGELVGDRAVARDRASARPADQPAAVNRREHVGDHVRDDQPDRDHRRAREPDVVLEREHPRSGAYPSVAGVSRGPVSVCLIEPTREGLSPALVGTVADRASRRPAIVARRLFHQRTRRGRRGSSTLCCLSTCVVSPC